MLCISKSQTGISPGWGGSIGTRPGKAELISGSVAAVAVLPRSRRAQQVAIPVIRLLHVGVPLPDYPDAFARTKVQTKPALSKVKVSPFTFTWLQQVLAWLVLCSRQNSWNFSG